MSRKELPRAGLVQAALTGQITNRDGAAAAYLSVRQFQRLKARVRLAGPLAVRHRGRGQPSRRRLPAALCAHVQALLQDRYAGFNDTQGARVAAEAQPGEVMVTGTVKDLVAGSGLAFEPRGERELKGVPGAWQIYAVEEK